MPLDPRSAVGVCGNTAAWAPPLSAWQTGGAGAGTIDPAQSSSWPWPPSTISGTPGEPVTLLPSYTPTGAVPTLPGPTFTNSLATATATVSVGNGWANPSDTAGLMVPIATCNYLDPWIGSAPLPSPLCTGGPTKRGEDAISATAAAPTITSPPR
jgi:glucan 1,3-beta-glucosidase